MSMLDPQAFPGEVETVEPAPYGSPGVVRGMLKLKGMDLRDYFAAKAMQGMVESDVDGRWCANKAYEIADAMMKARVQSET